MNQTEFKRPSLFSAGTLYLLAGMGLWLISYFSVDLTRGLQILLPNAGPELIGLLVSFVYYIPFVFFPLSLWCSKHEGVQQSLRLNPVRPSDMLRASVVALLALTAVQNLTIIWMILLQKLGLNVFVTEYIRPANMTELTLSVVSVAIIAPLGEEFLFRGVFFSAWERKGLRKAVLVSAVAFAMLHGSLMGLPGEIICGILMAVLVLWSDSIYVGLAFHSVYNAGSVMMNYISSALPVEAAEEALMRSDLLAYMGGYGAVLEILLSIVLDLAIIVFITRRMHMRHAVYRILRQVNPQERKIGLITPEKLREMMKQPPEIDNTPIGTGEALIMIAGIVTSLGLYATDILSMLGG